MAEIPVPSGFGVPLVRLADGLLPLPVLEALDARYEGGTGGSGPVDPADIAQAIADYFAAHPTNYITALQALAIVQEQLGPYITADQVNTALQSYATAQALSNGLASKVNSSTYTTGMAEKANLVDLARVAQTGAYSDLAGKPVIPTRYTDAEAVAANSTELNKKANTADLAQVAKTGAWADISGKPAIPATAGDVGAAPASHTHTIAQVSGLADALANAGSGGGTPTPGTVQSALVNVYGRFAKRDTTPVVIVDAGSSTFYGQGATTDNRRFTNRTVLKLQADFPLATGAAQPVAKYLNEVVGTTLPNGIQLVKSSIGGKTSNNYLDANTAAQVGALSPAMVLHAPVSNDYTSGVAPASSKTNILSKIAAINAAVPVPMMMPVHVLVHIQRRTDSSNPTAPWSSYGAVLKEIADADSANRVFVDIYSAYNSVLQDTTDPLGLLGPDRIHMTDAGHAFGADALAAALRETLRISAFLTPGISDPVPPADTTKPSITSFVATGQDGQVTLTWAASDNLGVTRYVVKRVSPAATLLDAGSGSTFTDTGRTNGTAVQYTLDVYDAAGNTLQATATATPVAGSLPTMANNTSPVISPTSATVGQVLTVTDGTWTPTPDSIARQWRRDGLDISGQTGTSYTTTSSDAGKTITCAEIPTKTGYQTGSAVVSLGVAVTAAPVGSTYAADNFDRTDGALGSTPTGGFAWNQSFDGGYAIVSGKAKPTNANGGQSMWVNDGQANGTLKVTVYETTTGLLFRATNGIGYYVFYSTGAGAWRFGKITGLGVFTPIVTATASTFVNPSTVEVTMDGSSFVIKINGTTIITATDTTYTDTQHGIISLYATNTADNFEHVALGVVSDYTSNLLARFNADSVSGSDGSPVASITSSGGSLGAVTLVPQDGTAASNQPILKKAVQNGHAVLRFASASNQKLQSPSSAIPTIPGAGVTYVYAFKRTGASSRYFGSNDSNSYHTLFNSGTAVVFANASVQASGNVLSYGTTTILDRWVIIVGVMNGASSKMFIASAGSSGAQGTEAIVTGTLTTVNGVGISMGGSGSNSGFATMDVYETRIYNEAVSDANVGIIIAALKAQLAL